MKFKKPSETNVKDTIALTGGAIAGGMASKAVFGFIHEPTTSVDAAAIKKDENTALLKRGGLILAAAALVACVDGNDTLTTLVKGTGVGIVASQGLEVLRVLSARQGVTNEAAATTPAAKAFARAVGLGCACDSYTPSVGMGFARMYDFSNMDVASQVAESTSISGYDFKQIGDSGIRQIA